MAKKQAHVVEECQLMEGLDIIKRKTNVDGATDEFIFDDDGKNYRSMDRSRSVIDIIYTGS